MIYLVLDAVGMQHDLAAAVAGFLGVSIAFTVVPRLRDRLCRGSARR